MPAIACELDQNAGSARPVATWCGPVPTGLAVARQPAIRYYLRCILIESRKTNPRLMEYKTWMCLICGWIYDEATGAPDDGIAPGTKWEDVPINWTCPECGARKEDFEMVAL
jgi:rubredoxin